MTTNKNVKKIFKQAVEFNVKEIIINDKNEFSKAAINFKKKKINVYNSLEQLLKKKKLKSYLTINAISGIDGLEPTLILIKHTKNLALANKESIICGWKLIQKKTKTVQSKFYTFGL